MDDNRQITELIVPKDLMQILTTDQAWHYSIVPKVVSGNEIQLYIDENKTFDQFQEELEILFSKNVKFVKVNKELISVALNKYYRKEQSVSTASKHIRFDKDDFLLNLIWEAHSLKSSDIHIEKFETNCRVRLRIDGKLIERYVIDIDEYPSIINKIKIKANLDIAEKRLPQDGRILMESDESKFDIRVSVLPSLFGEKIVLRLLNKDATKIDINELGLSTEQKAYYLKSVNKSQGIILISGPTGSGKTTTLYSTLKLLNKEDTNILTIEDPVEYTLDGVTQSQLREDIGLTFSKALRTFLRQDPDIIMLGEIRDGETAQMAIRAALTGHLVLSTVHTNSAWGIIPRLIDMDVPPYLLASTLNMAVAQRLIRLLCPDCKKEEKFDQKLLPFNFQELKIGRHYRPVGCEKCYYTGYKGRKAIFEVIPMDSELETIIRSENFKTYNVYEQYKIDKLSDMAIDLVKQGVTSIEEIYSILLT